MFYMQFNKDTLEYDFIYYNSDMSMYAKWSIPENPSYEDMKDLVEFINKNK